MSVETKRSILERLDRNMLSLLGAVARLEAAAKSETLSLKQLGVNLMADLTAIQAAVAKNTDAEKSAVVLLTHLSDLIKAAGTDPAKLADLTATLTASSADLAAAVVANTPVDPNNP